jgi:hypothetical protein
MSVQEAFGVHLLGVFWDETIDDEIFTVGALLIDFRGCSIGDVSGYDSAWRIE